MHKAINGLGAAAIALSLAAPASAELDRSSGTRIERIVGSGSGWPSSGGLSSRSGTETWRTK